MRPAGRFRVRGPETWHERIGDTNLKHLERRQNQRRQYTERCEALDIEQHRNDKPVELRGQLHRDEETEEWQILLPRYSPSIVRSDARGETQRKNANGGNNAPV